MNFDHLIELNDQDEILREIDRLCTSQSWDLLLDLRNACHLAKERGKQLWGAAAHAEYRLALQAPGEVAGLVLDSTPGPMALGPLTEVAASSHTWGEMSPFVKSHVLRGLLAYQRAALGEDLSTITEADDFVRDYELPLRLQAWEPAYQCAVYRPDGAEFPVPSEEIVGRATGVSDLTGEIGEVEETGQAGVSGQAGVAGRGAETDEASEASVSEAWRSLVSVWTAQSNGVANVSVVDGGLSELTRAAGVPTSELCELSPQSAVAKVVWAASSGGAHGRRPGLAAGRSKMWWALSAIADLADDDSRRDSAERLTELMSAVRWYSWSGVRRGPWELRLALVDPELDVAVAIEASDNTAGIP